MSSPTEASPLAQLYAALIGPFVVVGFVALLIAFLAFASGLAPGRITAEATAAAWHLSADEFAEETGLARGWDWVKTLPEGQALATAGLVFLASITPLAFCLLILRLLRRREFIYAGIAAAQLVVLVYAALSGAATG